MGSSAGATAAARPRRLHAFVAGTVAASLAVAIALLAGQRWVIPSPRRPVEFFLVVGLLVVGELFPITVQRGDAKDSVTISGPFACALLLRWPLVLAVLAQVGASLVDGAAHKVAWWARLFNAAQYAVSLAVAGWAFHVLSPPITAGRFDPQHFVAALLAGLVFFLLNNTLTAVGIALSEGFPLLPFLIEDFPFQAMTNGALIALAPILLVVMDRSVLLMAVLLIPFVAIYRSATVVLEKDHQARHDALTGLANRTELEALGTTALSAARAEHLSVAVMMIDLDHFKDVNDTLGHEVGDSLLQQVATRLRDALDGEGIVARFGGDQFTIIVGGLASPFEAPDISRRVLDQFGGTFAVGGSSFDLRASAGLAVFPQHGDDVGVLLRHAEIALEGAKASRTALEVYKPENNQYTWRRLRLATDLRRTLAAGGLRVHYQPIVDFPTRRIVGAESLLRWDHPEFGSVPPDEFVALAERTGSIRQLTEFVLNESLRQLELWRDSSIDVGISVNVSGYDLTAELPGRIATLLAISGLPSSRLTLELTETALVADPATAARLIMELKEMQVRIAIDDFGTGYSSLAYLKRLPVDEIKIDRSFVSHMTSDAADKMIVQSTIDLARNLELSVVGEGIETPRTWNTLSEMGCDKGQGYLVARPLPPEELTPMLESGAIVGRVVVQMPTPPMPETA